MRIFPRGIVLGLTLRKKSIAARGVAFGFAKGGSTRKFCLFFRFSNSEYQILE